MKQFFLWSIYLLTILCAGGWYIMELKQDIAIRDITIIEKNGVIEVKENEIKNLLISAKAPDIKPLKQKTKIIYKDKIVEKIVEDGQCKQEYTALKQKTLQCAYNLKFCQESSSIYKQMNKDRPYTPKPKAKPKTKPVEEENNR